MKPCIAFPAVPYTSHTTIARQNRRRQGARTRQSAPRPPYAIASGRKRLRRGALGRRAVVHERLTSSGAPPAALPPPCLPGQRGCTAQPVVSAADVMGDSSRLAGETVLVARLAALLCKLERSTRQTMTCRSSPVVAQVCQEASAPPASGHHLQRQSGLSIPATSASSTSRTGPHRVFRVIPAQARRLPLGRLVGDQRALEGILVHRPAHATAFEQEPRCCRRRQAAAGPDQRVMGRMWGTDGTAIAAGAAAALRLLSFWSSWTASRAGMKCSPRRSASFCRARVTSASPETAVVHL